jgi:hypothetical protein
LAVIWVNLRRAMGDRRLLIIGTLVPIVIILITGLLEGSPKEPIGLYHPSARLLHLAQTTDGVKVRIESSKTDLTDDILRGRVVAGIEQLPSPGNSVRANFLVESSTTDAVQARTDAVALLDLMAAEGSNTKFTDATLQATPTEAPLSPFWYVAPANLVLFMGIAVLVLSAGMVETRRLGVLQRLSAAPVHKRAIVFGQMASMMVARDQRRGSGGAHRHLVALAGAGHRDRGDRRHHRRHARRLRLPAERSEHDGEECRARGAAGVGHGRVRQADLRPRRLLSDAARSRRARRVRRRPQRAGGLVLLAQGLLDDVAGLAPTTSRDGRPDAKIGILNCVAGALQRRRRNP